MYVRLFAVAALAIGLVTGYFLNRSPATTQPAATTAAAPATRMEATSPSTRPLPPRDRLEPFQSVPRPVIQALPIQKQELLPKPRPVADRLAPEVSMLFTDRLLAAMTVPPDRLLASDGLSRPLPTLPAPRKETVEAVEPDEPDGAPRMQFLDKASVDYCKALWPNTSSTELRRLKSRAIFYDNDVMPPAYQAVGMASGGFHSPDYNVALNPDPFGNANKEFPWKKTGGMDGTNGRTVRFVVFPETGSIRYWTEHLSPRFFAPNPDNHPSYRWLYPAGTTFGELLLVPDGDSFRTFEVRTRTKTPRGWTPNVYRPFETHEEFVTALAKLNPEQAEACRKAEKSWFRVADEHPGRRVIDESTVALDYPEVDHAVVRKLLAMPFKSTARPWVTIGDKDSFAPTTKAALHIVPKDWSGSFVAPTATSCNKCHQTTLMHARDFDGPREWYGGVRGDDEAFSFHIVEPSSISYNGSEVGVQLRRRLVEAGLLKHWND